MPAGRGLVAQLGFDHLGSSLVCGRKTEVTRGRLFPQAFMKCGERRKTSQKPAGSPIVAPARASSAPRRFVHSVAVPGGVDVVADVVVVAAERPARGQDAVEVARGRDFPAG